MVVVVMGVLGCGDTSQVRRHLFSHILHQLGQQGSQGGRCMMVVVMSRVVCMVVVIIVAMVVLVPS